MTTKATKPKPAKTKGISINAAAKQMGVSSTTLRDWDRQGLTVKYPDGSVDYDATVQMIADNTAGTVSSKIKDTSTGNRTTLTSARTRKEQALAEKAEIEVAKLKGDLISVTEAEAVYLDIASRVRAALEAVPVRMMHRLVGLDPQAIRQLLTNEISQALGGLDNAPRPKSKNQASTTDTDQD